MSFGERYFFVDASNIEKNLWILHSTESLCNYYSNGIITARDIFDNFCIPRKYQKLVIKTNFMMFLKGYNAQELISDFSFYFINHNKKTSYGYVDANCVPFYNCDSDQWFYNFVSFKTLVHYTSCSSVVRFFDDLNSEGLLSVYFSAIRKLFDLNKSILKNIDNNEFQLQKLLKK